MAVANFAAYSALSGYVMLNSLKDFWHFPDVPDAIAILATSSRYVTTGVSYTRLCM
jgi:hypothetical protein